MLAAQMQKSADKAVAAVSVIITAARPVAVVGKILDWSSATGVFVAAGKPDGASPIISGRSLSSATITPFTRSV
jgi:hypothetical protein